MTDPPAFTAFYDRVSGELAISTDGGHSYIAVGLSESGTVSAPLAEPPCGSDWVEAGVVVPVWGGAP